MNQKQLLNFPVSIGPYSQFLENIVSAAARKESNYTCVANVHMLIEAYKNPGFASIIKNADTVTPDGKPLVWGLRLIHGIQQERVSGMDLLPDLLDKLRQKRMSVYFYGGTEALLKSTETFLQNNYPGLEIAGLYSPPFRTLSREEDEEVAKQINMSGANVIFVVLGCPKQERWMASMKGKIQAVMIGVGGALPVMAGLQKRAPQWIQQSGLEWLFRLLQEPRRLFKRYAVTNSMFVYLLLKEALKVKVFLRLSRVFSKLKKRPFP